MVIKFFEIQITQKLRKINENKADFSQFMLRIIPKNGNIILNNSSG